MKPLVAAVAALACCSVAACAMAPLTAPAPSLDSIQTIRAAALPPMSVGAFTPAPGRPADMDQVVMARAMTEAAPEGSFARYLGDSLGAQLKSAGKLDPASMLVVSGVITDTHLVTQQATSEGRLAARFTLSRAGKVVYDATLSVSDAWDSNYLGDVAIPDAFNHYQGLFAKLVQALLSDPAFQAAAKSP
ncbi:MAG TPA: hypothetical protein VGL58_04120 [Caulobacteraceae bacterium]